MSLHSPTSDTAPRYTSYPTAPHFHSGIDSATVSRWMGRVGSDEPISLYVHIPFCDKLCWFCACHTRHTLRYEPVADYLGLLRREIRLVADRLNGRGIVQSLHLGGGSPTMLRPDDIRRLAETLRGSFRFSGDAAFSVEIDPSDMDEDRLDGLASIGVTRASLGVQDFDPRVQRAINREQGFDLTRDMVEGLRARGIMAINLDLVYGLPHQTVDSVIATVDRCLELAPDRIALFGYAHVPWFKKHQSMIDEAWLPGPEARLELARRAAERIVGAGYIAVGIDHFGRPGDPLAMAMAERRLRRNFQGYTDDVCDTLIGLGPSSVSRYREGYAQNSPAMGHYVRAIEAQALPVCRGIALSTEDRIRGWLIERLMCDFGFSILDLLALDSDLGGTIVAEAEYVARHAPRELVLSGDRFQIPDSSRAYARSIAARFDTYLARGIARHSAAV
ncbi:MAG: oxygen-independent coproporphyrinogen III oxidase [Rhizobiaceae bacterium]|nr:oxygen-independent coproporphyrinogen III oxidase [Rhizobiaceae bacterium]MCV0407442.1 oxygen-independent coproporphyrinogen III oxidase [Rhizobiaceae bacterium]